MGSEGKSDSNILENIYLSLFMPVQVSVLLGDDVLCEASSQTSFSKQSAKDSLSLGKLV